MKYPHINFKKVLRKLKKKLLKRIFGYCYVHGHSWKMRKGWQSNPDAWTKFGEAEIMTGCATKPWVYYECRRCGAIAENE